ncbi:MAG TPA: hypothetical protein DEP72_04930 [Clostridiales bacterium]|nr:MAG: hypothetical protein A2Y18_02035 [Clostridiales bacterium GWD2_32_19]HCC07484.1 hypothetical protein [Clostridiales bacterium]
MKRTIVLVTFSICMVLIFLSGCNSSKKVGNEVLEISKTKISDEEYTEKAMEHNLNVKMIERAVMNYELETDTIPNHPNFDEMKALVEGGYIQEIPTNPLGTGEYRIERTKEGIPMPIVTPTYVKLKLENKEDVDYKNMNEKTKKTIHNENVGKITDAMMKYEFTNGQPTDLNFDEIKDLVSKGYLDEIPVNPLETGEYKIIRDEKGTSIVTPGRVEVTLPLDRTKSN